MFVVQFRAKGALACEAVTFGPFGDYIAAETFLTRLPAAAECEHKYIDTLRSPSGAHAANAIFGRRGEATGREHN